MLAKTTLDRDLASVTERVAALGEPHRVASAQNDKKSSLQFFAVRVPLLRQMVKQGFPFYARPQSDVLEVWDYIWQSSDFYEVMSAPLLFYQDAKTGPQAIFSTVARWVDRIENWGHADSLAAIFARICRNDSRLVYPFLETLSVSSNPWRRRVAVVSLVLGLRRGAFSVPLAQVWPILDHVLADQDPYVAKAVAWVIREVARADCDSASAYMRERQKRFSGVVLGRVQGELRRLAGGDNSLRAETGS